MGQTLRFVPEASACVLSLIVVSQYAHLDCRPFCVARTAKEVPLVRGRPCKGEARQPRSLAFDFTARLFSRGTP